MNFLVLILGSDANAYYMARCCYEAYKVKPHLIGQKKLGFTKFTNILTIEYFEDLWNEKEFIKKINSYAKKNKFKKVLLVSTNETYTEFIARNKEKLEDNLVFNLPDEKIIKTLTNKELFYKTYANSSLEFPKTLYFDLKDDENRIQVDYPVVMKPANVVEYNHVDFEGKNKIYKINSREELLDTIKRIKDSKYNDRLIIQEFIPGDDSYLYDSVVYIDKKGKCRVISLAQIGLQERTKTMVGNAAVLINGFSTFDIDSDKQIKDIVKFMESINYRGFAEIDMKYDARDNKLKVLEINARQGRCSYYLTPLGYNLIKVMADDLIYDENKEFKVLTDKVLLSFVPKGIIKKYCKSNPRFRQEALALWKKKNVVKPMDAKCDKNFLRFLQLRKRWLNYYKEYKNSYWK